MSRSHFCCGSLLFPSGMQWIWGKRPISRNPLVALDPWISTVSGACKSSSTSPAPKHPRGYGEVFSCHSSEGTAMSVSLRLSSTRGMKHQCHRLETIPRTQRVWPFFQLLRHLQFLSWKLCSYRGTLIFPGKARTFFKSLPSAICGYFLSFHLDSCTLSPSLLFIYPTGNS